MPTSFLDYFLTHFDYESKTLLWAAYFRLGAITNTINMFAEAFHKKLKNYYFNGRQNRRPDTLLQILVTVDKDHIYNQISKEEKGGNKKNIACGTRNQLAFRESQELVMMSQNGVRLQELTKT